MRRIIWCVTAAIIATFAFGSIYVTFQQIGRHAANTAPAAAAAARLQQEGPDTAAGPWLELAPDSGVFVIVYGKDNSPLSSTVTLHGTIPVVPTGVLEAARTLGTDAVTWQPETGLRMAIVARQADDNVVVAGQSLAPVEASDRMTLLILAAGWMGSMVVIAGALGAATLMDRRPGRVPWRRGTESAG
ncbi:hypothetical protein [Pseudarthrobacter sp. fls2-241-R2A-127]|uniref:hypothetical protein n=1 Tax=Pseudarthrobacter sp. fls2-241-R2A-127 TaxID=3040303 RepID=UPI002552181B|nr:hypothetical protein [Pseudarthrobacter sp. fls2-241-R2A-127]